MNAAPHPMSCEALARTASSPLERDWPSVARTVVHLPRRRSNDPGHRESPPRPVCRHGAFQKDGDCPELLGAAVVEEGPVLGVGSAAAARSAGLDVLR
jgi:hypothetical protein